MGLDSEIPITEREEDVCSGKRMAMELILSSADNVVKENGQSTVEVTSSSCDDSALRTHSTTRSLLKRLSTSSVKSTSKSEILSVTSVLSKLMEEVDILAAAYPTSLSEDKAILQSLCSSTDLLVVMTGNAVKQCSSSSGEKGESGADDPRSPIKDVDTDGVALNRCQLTACVRRRIERKELLLCAQNLLKGALSQAHT